MRCILVVLFSPAKKVKISLRSDIISILKRKGLMEEEFFATDHMYSSVEFCFCKHCFPSLAIYDENGPWDGCSYSDISCLVLTGSASFGVTEGDPRVPAPPRSTRAPTGLSSARMESLLISCLVL